MKSSHPNRGWPAFCLVLERWPKRTIVGNLSSCFCKVCPSYLNLSLIAAIESRMLSQNFDWTIQIKKILVVDSFQNSFCIGYESTSKIAYLYLKKDLFSLKLITLFIYLTVQWELGCFDIKMHCCESSPCLSTKQSDN